MAEPMIPRGEIRATDFQPRAFELLSRLPAGCMLFRQPDDWTESHIHAGERVVVDPNDREIEWGGVYLRQYRSGGRAIWQLRPVTGRMREHMAEPDEYGMWQPLRPNTRADSEALEAGRPVHIRMTDGPVRLSFVNGMIVGRVVGIYAPVSPSAELESFTGSSLSGLVDRLRDLEALKNDTLDHAEPAGYHGTADRTRDLFQTAQERLSTFEPRTPADLVELLGALAWLIGDDGSPQAVLARKLQAAAATILGEDMGHG